MMMMMMQLGEKFREDSEAIKQLFNREHGKLIELYSKYEVGMMN